MLYALIHQLSYCHKALHIQYVINDAERLLSPLDLYVFVQYAIDRLNVLYNLIYCSL